MTNRATTAVDCDSAMAAEKCRNVNHDGNKMESRVGLANETLPNGSRKLVKRQLGGTGRGLDFH